MPPSNRKTMIASAITFLILETQPILLLALSVFRPPTWRPGVFLTSIVFFGTQGLVLYWVRKPALTIMHLRRETLITRIGLYVILPSCVVLLLVANGLEQLHYPASLAIAAASLILVFWAGPIGVLVRDIGRHRLPFYESHCSKCLYDISTIEADTCPECNAPITRPEEAST